MAQLNLQPICMDEEVVEKTICATFGEGPETITLAGIIRVSPGDEGKEIFNYSNDGSAQFLEIFACAKVYAEVKKVRVNVARVFISIGVDRRVAEESRALAEINHFLLSTGDDDVLVVAADSMRLGLYSKKVVQTERIIKTINNNAEVRFIETWGLVNDDEGQELHSELTKAVEKREDDLRDVSKTFSKMNAGKSVKGDKAKQKLVKKKKKEIRKTLSTNTSITTAADLGVLLMKHLGWDTELRKNSTDNNNSVLGKFINKWIELVREGTDQAARKFTEFYEENKTDVNIDGFLDKNGISNIEELVVSLARTSYKHHAYPNGQIAMNCASEFILHNGNMPAITICDLGKQRDTIGNPGFVAVMILACSGRVKRVVMSTPVRASSEIEELNIMKDLEKDEDFFTFSECIGKDHRELFQAELDRKAKIAEIWADFKSEITRLEGKLLKTDDARRLYFNMKRIYGQRLRRYLDDAAYAYEESDEGGEEGESDEEESDEEESDDDDSNSSKD